MATKKGPGAHVLARKGTYEKLDGQLEMSFAPPKKDIYEALFGITPPSSWSRDYFMAMVHYESTFITDMQRARAQATATEVSRRQRDAERGIQFVDFLGRTYPLLNAAH